MWSIVIELRQGQFHIVDITFRDKNKILISSKIYANVT